MEPISLPSQWWDYFRQPFLASLNNGKTLSAFHYMLCSQISPFHPQYFVTIIIHLPYSSLFGSHMKSQRATSARKCHRDEQWNASKNVSWTHHLPARSAVFRQQSLSSHSVTCSVELIVEQEQRGFPFSTAPGPEYCSCLRLPPFICTHCSAQIRFSKKWNITCACLH